MPEDEGRSLRRGQLTDHAPQAFGDLFAEQLSFGTRIVGWNNVNHRITAVEIVGERLGLTLSLAKVVEAAVGRDPVDPGTEIGSGLKGVQASVATQKRILHYLFGIVFISHDPARKLEDVLTMAFDE